MVVLYLSQYSIFQIVFITILLSNLHLKPLEFVPLHLLGKYVPNFYHWVFLGFSYQVAYEVSSAVAVCQLLLL